MTDWRLNGQEEYLTGKTLYRIVLPDYWQEAYTTKNSFFQKIKKYAETYVRELKRGHEYLEGEKIGLFWHEHCEFCWDKAMSDTEGTFYCTEDMYYWVCHECFDDFKNDFNWTEKTAEELPETDVSKYEPVFIVTKKNEE